MEQEQLQIILVILGAILAYFFGRFQHLQEYKENLRNEIFETLLMIDLPNAYINFLENPLADGRYYEFITKLKLLVSKCAILQISKRDRYFKIKKLVEEIDELSCFTEYHLEDGIEVPRQITEINAIKNRKKQIDKKIKSLYRIIGTNNYKNILYVGYIKIFIKFIYDEIFNRYKD